MLIPTEGSLDVSKSLVFDEMEAGNQTSELIGIIQELIHKGLNPKVQFWVKHGRDSLTKIIVLLVRKFGSIIN